MKKTKRSKPNPSPAVESAEKQASENHDIKKIALRVDAFGQIVRDVKTEEINSFLDEHVPDKKFAEEETD